MQDIFDSNGLEESSVRFQPRALYLSGKRLPLLFKGLTCIADGKYCADLPMELQMVRNNLDTTEERSKYSPGHVIKQTLREQCVFDALKDEHKSHWFLYIK